VPQQAVLDQGLMSDVVVVGHPSTPNPEEVPAVPFGK
jgi:hypothetical protein